MRTKLDHVRANVADLRRAVAWYQDTLGFEVESYWPPDDPNYAHFKAAGGATFAVMEAAGRGARFNFTVDDPDELWERVKGSATVVESLFDTPLRHPQVHDRRPGRQRAGIRPRRLIHPVADSRRQKGTRPSFSDAARPEVAEPIDERSTRALRELGVQVETGVFGARMQSSW